MGGEYHLESLAVPESLDRLHDLLERVALESPDVSPEDLSMLETAVIEIAGNVVEHGRPPGQVVYSFRLEVGSRELVGELSDTGEALQDAVTAARGPADVDAEDGRGLFLARAVLDGLAYSRVDGHNVWQMVRRRR